MLMNDSFVYNKLSLRNQEIVKSLISTFVSARHVIFTESPYFRILKGVGVILTVTNPINK